MPSIHACVRLVTYVREFVPKSVVRFARTAEVRMYGLLASAGTSHDSMKAVVELSVCVCVRVCVLGGISVYATAKKK